MKLSIIIPALNEAASIGATIESAWALNPHEIIVADGGSQDATADIAASHECRVIATPRGRAIQQNTAAAAASGDVFLFLHADCRLVPEARAQMERTLRSPRIPGGVFRHRLDAPGFVYRIIEVGDDLRVCCTRIAYGDQGFFLRRDVFERLGGFPEVRLMEDVRLSRLLRDEGRLALLPGPLMCSARRWQKYGPLSQTFRNLILRAAESLGIHPDRLADLYAPHGIDKSSVSQCDSSTTHTHSLSRPADCP
mgnify:CR=1 FL=1